VNFFVANPDLLGGANLTTNTGAGTRAHSGQFEFRKRFSRGFAVTSSYTFSLAELQQRYSFNKPLEWIDQAGQVGNVRHALKANWSWEVPVGKERAFGSNMNGVLDAIVGGWSVDGVGRVQTGEVLDFGNVRLVGMTRDELQSEIRVQQGPGGQIFVLPADILDNTVRAFSVSATSPTGYGSLGAPTGRYFAPANGPDCIEIDNGADYGDCGTRSLVVTGPMFQNYDFSVAKRVPVVGRTNLEFRFEMLNALNNHNFVPVGGIGSVLNSYEVTALTGNNTARVIQVVTRFNW